jgi:hypothetical protein
MSEVRGNGDTELSDRSIADLLKQLSDQTATLVRQELDLARPSSRSRASGPAWARACLAVPGCSGFTPLER